MDYTYTEIRNHIREFEKEEEGLHTVFTLEIFGDDSAVYLIDIDDNRICRFKDLKQFMECKSLYEAKVKYPLDRKIGV